MSHHINLVRLRVVATSLAELNERVIFVGGAVLSLYATDVAAPEPRPTDDIDVVVEVSTYTEFSNQIEERLRALGFVNDMESSVICRYKIIRQSPLSVRSHLKNELSILLTNANVDENIYAHLEVNTASRRTERILNIWKEIVAS